ncbi:MULTISPECIES: YgdI/YgdR family lipoprotein [Rahnella]|uniref:YgdI/YgdR family lipoprotein n=1 Tax=Rahnella variigena TaxID=574964 RepID=A0ABX9PYG6_9GAMM|nr:MULTISPECIES: YgdI/YgdR family lipoprotein [Rahnella]RJT54723.1 YgdI/YgdR family lipoprotein [Rahnella variigena]RKF69057.1 YgdI/YgdR family lipoprotein [Rahnella variigena]
MKKLSCLTAIVLAMGLSGCASDYVINTKAGDQLFAHGEPERDRDTGMTSYTDMNGDYHLMNTNDIAGIVKK